MKLCILHRSGSSFLQDSEKDFHTKWGVVRSKDVKIGKIVSNTGEEFLCCPASQGDLLRNLKRKAQVILPKDAAAIIAETGVHTESKVGDAGSGSGWLACFLGGIVKEVHSYEVREDHKKVVDENISRLGLKNVKTHLQDITQPIKEKGFDLFVLDMPTPWEALETMTAAIKQGGFLVVYLPHITQSLQFVNGLSDSFLHLKTFETLQRAWMVEGKKARPETQQLHTGFISVCRKV